MRPHLLASILATLTACKRPATTSDDCAVIAKDPANAMTEIAKRHPGDPVKVAETIEKCVAPTGDECARVAAIVKAIPSMAPQLSAPRTSGDYEDICKTSPPELRRCFLPSYAIAHADECKALRDELASKIEIKPGDRPGGCNGGVVAIYVTSEGTWIATGKDAASRCYAERKGGQLDLSWLEAELKQFVGLPCLPTIELASEDEVLYKDVIHTMDVAVKVGLSEVGLSTVEELSAPMNDATADKSTQAHCPATTIALESGSAAPLRKPAPVLTGSGSDALAKAPVVIITRDEITVGGSRVASVKESTKGTGAFDELAKALPPARDGLLILQADESTPSVVIDRVVTTSKAAGFDNILFAVKKR
jgi:biopolymer transport protein ExbD